MSFQNYWSNSKSFFRETQMSFQTQTFWLSYQILDKYFLCMSQETALLYGLPRCLKKNKVRREEHQPRRHHYCNIYTCQNNECDHIQTSLSPIAVVVPNLADHVHVNPQFLFLFCSSSEQKRLAVPNNPFIYLLCHWNCQWKNCPRRKNPVQLSKTSLSDQLLISAADEQPDKTHSLFCSLHLWIQRAIYTGRKKTSLSDIWLSGGWLVHRIQCPSINMVKCDACVKEPDLSVCRGNFRVHFL